jgi:hypothetical protein
MSYAFEIEPEELDDELQLLVFLSKSLKRTKQVLAGEPDVVEKAGTNE